MTQTVFNEEQLKQVIGGVPTKDFQTAGLISNNQSQNTVIPEDQNPIPEKEQNVVLPNNDVLPTQTPIKDWRENIPEQFHADTQEEALAKMAQAYNELSQSNTKAQEELQQYNTPDIKAPEETAEEAFGKSLAKTLEDNNIDGLDIKDRFYRYEELTAADYKKLEEAGINPTLFENSLLQERTNAVLEYKNAQEKELQQKQTQEKIGLSDQDTATILQEFADGNTNTFEQMAQWGAKNLGQGVIDGIQNAINTGDINITRAALSGLKTAYIASQGQEKPLAVTGGQSPTYGLGAVDAQEAQKIFNDPRYRSKTPADRAWRAQQMSRKWL